MALICKITGNTRAAVARQTVLVSLWQRSSLNIFGNRGQDEGSSRAAVRIREFSCWPCRGALLRISELGRRQTRKMRIPAWDGEHLPARAHNSTERSW